MAKLNVQSISAVTLAVADMARSVDFYRDKVGLEIIYGAAQLRSPASELATGI